MTLNDLPKSLFLSQLLILESISEVIQNASFMSFLSAFTAQQMSESHQSAACLSLTASLGNTPQSSVVAVLGPGEKEVLTDAGQAD